MQDPAGTCQQVSLELSCPGMLPILLHMIKNDKTETVTLTIKKSSLKKLARALKEMNDGLDETYTVEQYLEHELNTNIDGLIEMLMSDY